MPGDGGELKPIRLRLLDERGRRAERKRCEGSLFEFFARAWGEIDPAPFVENWHMHVVADQLEELARGETRDLILNLPPRTGKTNLISVCFPAWVWCQDPERGLLMGPQVSFLCLSYGAVLAEVIATRARRLIMGEWYQSLWGDRVQIRDDQASRADFGNTAGGERISNSIEGGILGRGASVQIIDDPHKLDEIESEAERERTIRALKEGLPSRVTDPRISARILTMQRLHELDATAYALENWRRDHVHVMLPARFDPDRPCFCDERTYDGELLWPEVWTEGEITKLEIELGSYAASGQLQQSPIPRGGGIITQDDWQIWPEFTPRPEDLQVGSDGSAYVPLPEVTHVILVLDTALSERNTADWNACVVMGVWHRPTKPVRYTGGPTWGLTEEAPITDDEQPRVILMGGWRARCKLNDEGYRPDGQPKGLVQRVIATARRFNVDRIVIEDQTRGRDVRNEIIRQFAEAEQRIELFNPKRHGDKVARLWSVQPLFSQKLVYAPAHCVVAHDQFGRPYVDVQEYRWVKSIIDEVSQVPRGRNDDYADDISMGLITLREGGFLALTAEYMRRRVEARMFRRKPITVAEGYGV
jgi:phage terminase large subunit-like protein